MNEKNKIIFEKSGLSLKNSGFVRFLSKGIKTPTPKISIKKNYYRKK